MKVRAYTDIEQGKKLAEILPVDSADMYWKNGVSNKYIQCLTPFVINDYRVNADFDYDIPCWSLGALLERLPMPALIQDKADDVLFWQCSVYNEEGEEICETYASDKVDACYEMCIKLHGLKIL